MRRPHGWLVLGGSILALSLGLTIEGCPGLGGNPGDGGSTLTGIAADCVQCHAGIVERYTSGVHQSLQNQCQTCHPNALDHMADVINVRAAVNFSLEACAQCHTSHYESYLHDDGGKPGHFGGSAKSSKYDEFPEYQYLMGGHGFTVEYTEDRAHAYMLKDHLETQRKQTTTCLQCKSTPVAYYWNERTRGEVQFEKTRAFTDAVQKIRDRWPQTVDYGAGCTHCHDPHNGDFRLIRKGVIHAILARGTDPYSPSLNVIPASETELRGLLNERGSDGRLTDQARRLAGTLTCSQCHIEYVCGQGADRATTGEIRDDVPWRRLADIEEYYQDKFNLQQDWKHGITGLNGIKPQHPETESYWGSVHHRLRMSCADCHMARAQDAEGRSFTSHWLTSPLKNNTAQCAQCHEDVEADVFAIQDAVYAQAGAVEQKLKTLLNRIEAANSSGTVPAETLTEAKALYMRALTWWEWTAVSENSMGAHFGDQTKSQLQTADDLATQGLGVLP